MPLLVVFVKRLDLTAKVEIVVMRENIVLLIIEGWNWERKERCALFAVKGGRL